MIGMILALFMVLAAFEYKTYDALSLIEFSHSGNTFIDEDLVINTKQEKLEPPQPIAKSVVIVEVDNNKDVEDIIIIDVSSDPLDEVPEFIYTPPDEIVPKDEGVPFLVVESMPEFPGGEEALIAYLNSNTRFTQLAIDAGIVGTVYVGFVVEKDGSISNVKLLRDLGGGLGEICVEVVKNMPRWTPGKQRGIPVRVTLNAPFNFELH